MDGLARSNREFLSKSEQGSEMKVAIVHDWLVTYAGAERVLAEILNLYPQADVYTIVDFMSEKDRDFLKVHKVFTSFIQKLPYAKKKYRSYLPLMPYAIETFDLSSYDLVISSSHAIAKGVITGPDQKHICVCYSPIRYAWDLQHQYLKESGLNKGFKGIVARYFLHKIRLWDYRTANGVDHFVSISDFISKRIWKVYRRESDVAYPPVDTEAFECRVGKENFYLTASRMVPYKKMDLIVAAFKKMPDKQLIVIGDGPDYTKISKLVGNSANIALLGYQSSEVLKDYMQKSKGFVFAAEEDFGIAPLEAQACGTPVIAYGKGGALETIINQKTGLFFKDQTEEALIKTIRDFESLTFDPQLCRENAKRFSKEKFRNEFKRLVDCYLQKDVGSSDE